MGLRWVDVDLNSGRIAIRHTLVMVDGKPAMAEPKTAKGRRSLTLLRRCWTPCVSTGPIKLPSGCPGFRLHGLGLGHHDRGRSAIPPRDASGLFVRQAKRAGLPPIRLHDLRHSVASILLTRGVHPKVVSEMLGHATIALTLDTYSHVIPSLQQEAASVVAAAVLDPAATAPQPGPEGQVRAITSGS